MMEIIKHYPYEVIIKKIRGASCHIIRDKARRHKRKSDNTEIMQLKKEKANFPIPSYEYIYSRKNGKPLIFLTSPTFDVYLPTPWEDNPGIKPVDKDIEFWHDMEVDRLHKTYQEKPSIWLMVLPLVAVGIMIAALLLTYLTFGKTMADVASSAVQAAKYAAQAQAYAHGIAPLS